MKNPRKPPTLIATLSVRFEHAAFLRLLAASKRERRTVSDYVRLLVERAENEHGRKTDAPSSPNHPSSWLLES